MRGKFSRNIFWGISAKQFLVVILFYIFIGTYYYITVTVSQFETFDRMPQLTIFYAVIAAITLPLWWLYFIFLTQKPVLYKLLLHLLTCPLFIFLLITLYHFFCDAFGVDRLKGSRVIWDINYATLVYGLQFGVFHFYEYHLKLQKQLQRQAELETLALQTEVSLLKAQVQPHFLFNTLNSISASVPREQEKTRVLISKLADTFRYALQASKEEFVSLQDELCFMQSYLALEKERFGNNLEIDFSIDQMSANAKVPSMLLQPLVENAIKHGISQTAEGGKIIIHIYKENKFIHFEISDTGAGGDINLMTEKKEGVGLHNTMLRLSKLYNETMCIKDNIPHGICLLFKIPYTPFSENA